VPHGHAGTARGPSQDQGRGGESEMSIKARRKGSTTQVWSNDPSKVTITVRTAKKGTPRIALTFWMPSKGGGYTDVQVSIDTDRFATMIRAMIMADDAATLQAVGSVLTANPDATIKACGAILLDQAGLADSIARTEAAPLAGVQASSPMN
jgi:hypothetical protein